MVVISTDLPQTACSRQYISTSWETIDYEAGRNLGNQSYATVDEDAAFEGEGSRVTSEEPPSDPRSPGGHFLSLRSAQSIHLSNSATIQS